MAEQQQHGQVAQAFGLDGYFWTWGQATFENWQSEFLQVFVFIVLTTFLVHRKSHEAPDHRLRHRSRAAADRGKSRRAGKQVAK